ncbi:UNVERIFIED_CONTAM: hypothetical protein B566_EDAN018582 [Ephemera danica]|nr:hypothetical protein B566_EDAN018582 [Ephemera danica]
MTLCWKHPFTSIVAGPTGSGKSYFVFSFLRNIDLMIDKQINEVIWCYGADQILYEEVKKSCEVPVRFIEGIPSLTEIAPERNPPPRLVIIDDLMLETNDQIVNLFTKGSHHQNLSIVFITQNVFHQGKGQRDISLNAHYLVAMKNPRDRQQILHLARQICPENPRYVQESFSDATSVAYGYLLFDMKQDTPDEYRLRSKIFPAENNVVYVQKRLQKPGVFNQNTIENLDSEMNKILETKGKSDYEKWQEYNQVLQKYLRQYEKVKEPIKIPIEKETNESDDVPQQIESIDHESPEEDSILNTMVNSFSKNHRYRNKAQVLYGILKRSPDIKWDTNGRVYIKDQIIRGSNIVDLLNDVVRSRQGEPPTGWEQFANVLAAINVPREYIGNDNRWNYILALGNTSETSIREHQREIQQRRPAVRRRKQSQKTRSRSRSPVTKRWTAFRMS